jgi:hypothetical protein
MSKIKTKKALIGKELLRKLKTLEHLSKSEKAKACGYLTRSHSGQERAQLSEFMAAIVEAQGLELDRKDDSDRPGRVASYRLKVQKNQTLVICPAYTKAMGINPGETFEIKLGSDYIKLLKVSEEAK